MQVIIAETPAEVAQPGANQICRKLAQTSRVVLERATGSTPVALYKGLNQHSSPYTKYILCIFTSKGHGNKREKQEHQSLLQIDHTVPYGQVDQLACFG